ncbi:MAG: glycosyltransferase family 2 protein [Burkholderiaceae bacterium]
MPTDHSDLPLVSVVIPAYNAAATLSDTLDSVLAQTWRNIEIVVVDDGSRDGTPDVLARYAPGVRALHQANGGLAAARNAGVAAARGRFVALLDADDLCEPERIGAQVALMTARPDIVLCGSEFSCFDDAGIVSGRFARRYYSRLGRAANGPATFFEESARIDIARWLPQPPAAPVDMPVMVGDVHRHLALGNFIHPPTVMFRRGLMARVGEFDRTIPNCCDWEWLMRAARAGKFAFIDRPLLRYRRSPAQMSGPRHKLQLYSDILANLRQFAHDDPELRRWGGRDYRRALGNASLDLAGALVQTDRLRALGLLARAAFLGVVERDTLHHLAKALAPTPLVHYIQSRRAAVSGAR